MLGCHEKVAIVAREASQIGHVLKICDEQSIEAILPKQLANLVATFSKATHGEFSLRRCGIDQSLISGDSSAAARAMDRRRCERIDGALVSTPADLPAIWIVVFETKRNLPRALNCLQLRRTHCRQVETRSQAIFTVFPVLRRSLHFLPLFCTLSKQEVLALGTDLPLELTFSCLAPKNGEHCRRCNKCAKCGRVFSTFPKGTKRPCFV